MKNHTITRHPGAGVLVAAAFALLSAVPSAALAATGDFTILAGTAVTCTDSTVTGDVGVWPGTAITQTSCTIDGQTHAGTGVARQAYESFLAEYDRIAEIDCDEVIETAGGSLDGLTLSPGVYCVTADSTTTNGTLTLSGGGTYVFKIGTGGTGALTGTGFTVLLDDAEACDVTWWVAEAATLTDSDFAGTILAGMAITNTGTAGGLAGTFDGDAYAKAAVTVTDTDITGCEDSNGPGNGHRGQGCNQGVGNGPEECDPGNSNQGDDSRSNDELGGTPGDPGRKGGNGH